VGGAAVRNKGNGIIKRSHQNDKIKKFKWQMAGKLLARKRLEKQMI